MESEYEGVLTRPSNRAWVESYPAESCRSVKYVPYRVHSYWMEMDIKMGIGVAPSVALFDPPELLKRGDQGSGG